MIIAYALHLRNASITVCYDRKSPDSLWELGLLSLGEGQAPLSQADALFGLDLNALGLDFLGLGKPQGENPLGEVSNCLVRYDVGG